MGEGYKLGGFVSFPLKVNISSMCDIVQMTV